MWPLLADIMQCAVSGDVWKRLRAAGTAAPALLRWAELLGQALDRLEAAAGGDAASGRTAATGAAASGDTAPAGAPAMGPPSGDSAADSSSSSSTPEASDAGTEPDQQAGSRQAQLAEGVALCVDCWSRLQACCEVHEHHAAHAPCDCTLLAAAFTRVARHVGSSPHMPATLYAITSGLYGCLPCVLVKVGSRSRALHGKDEHVGVLACCSAPASG